MYVNDRDQINYHGFLTALRTMQGYSLKHVSAGVCCESGMNRFEKGNRVAEKLVRDRLTARLGVSCEKYEDYLQPKEYVRWEQRLRIIKAIEKKDLKTAKSELTTYEAFPNLNRTNQQFVEAMRYMLLRLEGASGEELWDSITKAVKLTVPNSKRHFKEGYLLADQEVNLLLEQMSLEAPKKVMRDEHAWRILEYEKLITYMEGSCWEKLQKAKVYPKVTYYICKEILEMESAESEIRRGLKLCHDAIELLRDTSRLYYFIELTETRRALAERLMEFDISEAEKSELENMLTENNQWEKVFKDLYTEYQVAPYMSDFCYLYYENECHDMVEVIETRRKMLGISRAKLSDGVCTEKTIIRFEREGVNPTIDVVRRLFDKMGMCAEYRRARVVTSDVEALMLSIEVTNNMNNYDFEIWRENLRRLKAMLCMDIPHNQQEIMRLETLLKFRTKEIDREQFCNKSKDILGCTLPISAIIESKDKYLTRNEISSVYDIAFMKGEDSKYCFNHIQNICEEAMQENINISSLTVYEVITSGLMSYFGNIGEYEKSNEISHKMMKECLSYRRLEVIADNLYNNLWNYQQSAEASLSDKNFEKENLNKCLAISILLNKSDRITFFQNKTKKIFVD